MKPFVCFIEGSIGCGKSSVTKLLREQMKYVTLLDLTGNPDKTVSGEDKTLKYHKNVIEMFEKTKDLGMNWVVSRSFLSEKIYCNLSMKPYDFELNSHLLRQELEYLTKFYDVYFIQLTATEEQLVERLKRDKFEYVKHSVSNALVQQEEYKKEMLLLAKECENIKVFEIQNDNLQATVNTIQDLILSGMIG